MPEPIPEEAVREATEAYSCAWTSGVSGHETLVRIVLEAAAPILAAHERRKTIEEMTARLRRAAAGRREYDRGEPPTWAHEALQAEAATFETAVRVLEDPMAMLGLIPSWMWTAEEEARFDEPSPCEVAIDEARADERRKVAEEIAAEIERVVVSGHLPRPQVERGGFLNDARWAARIARQIGDDRDSR